jgi:hypothetical protein
MPSCRATWGKLGCTLGLLSMLLLASAGSASAAATVRFVHAVPGAGAATLSVSVEGAGISGSPVSFGTAGEPLEVRSGRATLTVAAADGGDRVAATEQRLEDERSYTAVALPAERGDDAELRVYADRKPRPGEARVRAIHAGPELGEPDVRVGERAVAEKLAYGDATEYVEVSPGTYDISVTRAAGAGGALATKRDVPLTAGTATTAVVVGSRGQPTRIVALSDGTAAPPGDAGPATGFGGLAGDGGPSRLALALLFAVAAGGLGAAGWALTGRR